MIETDLLIANLLPIECEIRAFEVAPYVSRILTGEELPPIGALPFPEDDSEEHIVLNGHHRSRAYHNVGRLTVPSLVCVTDEDAGRYFTEPATDGTEKPSTKESLRETYRTYWSIMIRQQGIVGVGDIPARSFKEVTRGMTRSQIYEVLAGKM